MDLGNPSFLRLRRLQRIREDSTFTVAAFEGLSTVKPLVLCITEVASGSCHPGLKWRRQGPHDICHTIWQVETAQGVIQHHLRTGTVLVTVTWYVRLVEAFTFSQMITLVWGEDKTTAWELCKKHTKNGLAIRGPAKVTEATVNGSVFTELRKKWLRVWDPGQTVL